MRSAIDAGFLTRNSFRARPPHPGPPAARRHLVDAATGPGPSFVLLFASPTRPPVGRWCPAGPKMDPPVPADPRPARDAEHARLLEASARGNAAAFEALYRQTAPLVLASVRRLAGVQPFIEDVLADTFLQAWRDAARFEPARGSALTWLLTIARSRALDRLRIEVLRQGGLATRPGAPAESEAPPASDPQWILQQLQDKTRLHTLLDGLAPKERWVLSLAYFRDLTQAEIADQTGMPLGTVKSLMNRAQHKLRDALGPSGEQQAGTP